MNDLHRKFVQLGRERNRVTYKLLALLPKIYELKIFEREGYANIYDYAARIAGISSGVVKKTLKLETKLKNLPHLRKVVETQGVHKVGIVAGLATKENELELAEKVEHMSKPALQEYSKEKRGKFTVKWQVELDKEMMFMFLKLKKQLGKNLTNKECLRRILTKMMSESVMQKNVKGNNKTISERKRRAIYRKNSLKQEQVLSKIPGEKLTDATKVGAMINQEEKGVKKKISRYISVHQKRGLSDQCAYPRCHRPAEENHHPERFSLNPNHNNLEPLCKLHHEFAHNDISEKMQTVDYLYRKYRQEALC